ncbi:hypothetical protein SAMN05216490_0143 [Mucilaginibacter mallensis]|uniref:Uncharacterized protein n=1 Tax=Mucilaginibacter mallensis TaxID=652787 RepID=A0A1H1MR40_MUCMA|nr:hypothetical protein [Mucilaginibacter mallensis]SDR89271.1 hypothetical protein SAMN05216490_0143 [Mucilaginibacter mallensis]
MALINILAKTTKSINWDEFLKNYWSLNVSTVEVFPIPKELGFDYDSVGISVHAGYADRSVVISEIEHLVTFFRSEPYNLKFIELYDGVEVLPENVIILINKLLPP